MVQKFLKRLITVVSGNCTGYIKSDFFVTGSSAKSRALDNGYVQAEAKDAIHVRAEASTNSKVVTNVYKNETYTIKKFDKTGEWIKVKIKAGVSGWISAQYANVNINMETAITRKEEKAKIKKEREAAKAAAKAAAEEEARKQAEQQEQQATHHQAVVHQVVQVAVAQARRVIVAHQAAQAVREQVQQL